MAKINQAAIDAISEAYKYRQELAQARIVAKQWFEYKKTNPGTKENLTPLQRRMQSGDL